MGHIFDGGNIGGGASGSGIPDAPSDGKIYGRQNGEWIEMPAGGGGVPGMFEPGASIFGGTHSNPSEPLYPGATIPAGSLYPASVYPSGPSVSWQSIDALGGGGTWELRGYFPAPVTGEGASLYARIDDASLLGSLSGERSAEEFIRNLQYTNADGTAINCEVCFRGEWHPFTATPTDVTPWCRIIYERAVTGEYGAVAVYE